MGYRHRYRIPEDQLSPYGTRYWHSPYHLLAIYEARRAYSSSLGITPEMHERAGLTIVPVKAEQTWHAPIHVPLGEEVVALVRVYPVRLGIESITFGFRIYREGDPTEKLRAEALVTTVFMDMKTGKAVPVPDWFRAHVESGLLKPTSQGP